MTPLFEVKTDLLLKQTRLHLPAFSEGKIEIDPIEKGGSDRRFYRVRFSGREDHSSGIGILPMRHGLEAHATVVLNLRRNRGRANFAFENCGDARQRCF